MGLLVRKSNLVIVILVIKTATFFYWHTASTLEDKPWFAEAATDTGSRTVGGGFLTGWDTSWTTFYILCIRRAWVCTVERKALVRKMCKEDVRKKERIEESH